MTRDIDFLDGKIKANISALSDRIPYENTWFRVEGKLVSGTGIKPGV